MDKRRRELFKFSALMGAAGVLALPLLRPRSSEDVRKARSRVAVLRASSYSNSLEEPVRQGLNLINVDVRGKKVLLKPNFVESVPDRAANTSPAVIAAAVECFRRMDAAEIVIGEGPGHQRDTRLILSEVGIEAVLKEQRLGFVDLNRDELVKTAVRSRYTGLEQLWLPKTVLESDLVVSMPKVKTHHWVGVTLSMKNQFGVIPGIKYGWPKNVLHWHGIENSILDTCSTVPIQLVIADGIVAMEGDGPLNGDDKRLGALVVADDPVAADATLTRLMGLVPERVGYLAEAGKFLGNLSLDAIVQVGETIDSLRQRFEVVPQFRHLLETES